MPSKKGKKKYKNRNSWLIHNQTKSKKKKKTKHIHNNINNYTNSLLKLLRVITYQNNTKKNS